MIYNLIATCKQGLESLVKDELKKIGISEMKAKDGEVGFSTDEMGLIRSNLWLRTAERILMKLAVFHASTFDELFEGIKAISWHTLLPEEALIRVMSHSYKSKLMSDRTVQSIAKKAIIEGMKKAYPKTWMPESGPEFKIYVDLLNDEATITLDTSGDGLHKRGYRKTAGEAPLRETLAAAMVLLSRWQPPAPLFDPFCGSGTIAIEAALIGLNVAPGLNRNFAAENLVSIPRELWTKARYDAELKINSTPFLIRASDIDGDVLRVAQKNAEKAKVASYIDFQQKSIDDFDMDTEEGVVIVNPPYGERLQDQAQAELIYKTMGQVFPRKPHFRYFALSPHPQFEILFGRKAHKNRKLYNGPIKCYFYEF